MIDLPIDCLSKLDYVDIMNLCKTSRQMSLSHNNSKLKAMIAIKSSLILPVDTDISAILVKLDNNINGFIDVHYNILPKWVDKELFIIDFKKRFYDNLVENSSSFLDDELFEKDGTIIIELSRFSIAFALVSSEYEGYRYDEIPVYSRKFILFKQLVDYITNTVSSNFKEGIAYHDLERVISVLLFRQPRRC